MSIFLAGLDCCVTNISRSRAVQRPSPILSFLLPYSFHTITECNKRHPRASTSSTDRCTTAKTSSKSSIYNIERTFISGLVRAGQCQQHRRSPHNSLQHISQHRLQSTASTTKPRSITANTRQFSARSRIPNQAPSAAAYQVSREELGGLIDQYDYAESQDLSRDESRKVNHFFSGQAPSQPEPVVKAPYNDAATLEILKRLQQQVGNPETPHDIIWQTYQDLPVPRAPRLHRKLLADLFHNLSVVEYKSTTSMSRYLSLVEDARAASIPLTQYQWTSAIAFAGRFVTNIASSEVESAMQLWRQMEQQAGMQATAITFNVLFDIATKARKFVLAEMIMKEMQGRGLSKTRFFRTSLIEHYGLRQDGDGVRKAYKELVEAGEIVDSVVITCVVKALLSCGEAVAAEQVFARAKRLHLEKTGAQLPPKDWRQKREIGRMLDAATRRRRQTPGFRARAEAAAPLAPQLSTYKALIFHYAIQAGDLDRITELVDELRHWGVAMHGVLYMYIFHGFAKHGGVLYTAWSRRRLEQTWKSLVSGIEHEKSAWGGPPVQADLTDTAAPVPSTSYKRDQIRITFSSNNTPTSSTSASSSQPPSVPKTRTPDIYPTRVLLLVILRAFLKVAGPERTWDVWSEAQTLWSPPDEDTRHIEEQLEAMMPDRDQSGKSAEDELKGHIEGLAGMGEQMDADTA